ncbi:uncharacterized protein LOC133818046 [Humulus lupulus]|uniref:uncharacterized protein LOC133818046 n=1 Tax=Humulus lupulus TaxID=3486 RepID=UPI002B40182F|nr:uncharacterized protein LOC133818046 [Humulus lupulus]
MVGRSFRLIKERLTKIAKHDRCRAAMAAMETMGVDPILNRALNEFTSAMLTLTAGHIRLGAIVEEVKTSDQRHEEELKAVEARYADQLAAVTAKKAKLEKELEEKQKSLEKARESRDQYKESNRSNYKLTKQLELDLIASRLETKDMEARAKSLEGLNEPLKDYVYRFMQEAARTKRLNARSKELDSWVENDFLCKNFIVSGLSDDLYDHYNSDKFASEIWEALQKKYDTLEARTKKYAVRRYLKYQIVDDKSVEAQSHELQKIPHEIISEGMTLDEQFQVAVLIDKLPPSWKDFKSVLRH